MKKYFIVAVFVWLLGIVSVAYAGSYQEGDQGSDIVLIQTRLNELGYDAGYPDGDFGAKTQAAVIAFQKDCNIEPDGVVGNITYRALLGRDIPVSRDGSTSMTRRIVQYSMKYRGVPYAFGGNTPAGFDCSGFTRYVYAQAGINLPRMADEQYEVGRSIAYGSLQPGDLVFFTTYADGASHVGIFVGDGKFINASSSRGVVVDYLNSSYWGPRYLGARRVL